MRLRVGTSGFGYKEWKGHFYPEDLSADAFLGYYAEHFDVVEINNTFYRMPRTDMLEKWAAQVPETFTFVLKASRRITHQQKLQETDDSVAYLLKQSSVLGTRRGPFLFQLPPTLRQDLPALKTFLQNLPSDVRAAFEFRHNTWRTAETVAVLQENNQAVCVGDNHQKLEDGVPTPSRWGYFRLHREQYSDEELSAWATMIKSKPWDEVFVFFKHEDEGTGPKLAKRFRDIW